jgi:hypothetical protein
MHSRVVLRWCLPTPTIGSILISLSQTVTFSSAIGWTAFDSDKTAAHFSLLEVLK